VFDDIERRRILEQPAGKHRAPGQRRLGIGVFFDIDLHKCADFGRRFPRQGALARGQAHHDIAHPARLAGLHHQVLRHIVALVEQTDGRHPILDRSAELALDRRARSTLRLRHFLGHVSRLGIRRRIALPRTGTQRQHGRSGKG
jgi:hypothetical protein